MTVSTAGCSYAARDTDEHKANKRDQDSAQDQGAKRPEKTMSPGFAKAHASFRDHAARQLSVEPKALRVMPEEEQPVAQLRQKVGNAWAFQATVIADPQRYVRGWAVADGRVITPEMNLDALMDEASFFSATPTMDADAFAELLTWAIPGGAMQYATRERADDGSGTFTFVVMTMEPPMGAHPGPEQYYEYKVTWTADHRVSVAKRHNEGSPPSP